MIKARWEFRSNPVAAMRGLRNSVKRRITKKAVRNGAKLVVRDLKGNLPKRTGALRVSIGSRVQAYRDGSVVVGVVGPKTKYIRMVAGRRVRPVYYMHLVEGGRKMVRPKKAKFLAGGGSFFGKSARAVPPSHAMRSSFGRKQSHYVETIRQVIQLEVAKELAKNA